jgi:hypothetical protein
MKDATMGWVCGYILRNKECIQSICEESSRKAALGRQRRRWNRNITV